MLLGSFWTGHRPRLGFWVSGSLATQRDPATVDNQTLPVK
jgi:hypothetical protein